MALFLRHLFGIARTTKRPPLAVEWETPPRKEFREALLSWFREFRRDLPWRRTRDPYAIWISEVMLQQTRVAAAISYYERFLQRFPDVFSLASAPEQEVLRLWSGLGYYNRARNLHQAAKQIVAEYGGRFPQQKENVLRLAGIGEYTAAAILSIAFGRQLAVLDGNVARVLARLGAVRGDLREPRRWGRLQSRADELLAQESPGDWNQAMMELGATLCTPRSPQCLRCPVHRYCMGSKLGIAGELPEKRKKREAVEVRLVAAVLLDGEGNSRLMAPPTTVVRVKSDDDLPALVAKLWHFPTISAVGSVESAAASLLKESLRLKNWRRLRPEALPLVRHTVTYRKITLAPFLVRIKNLPRIPGARSIRLDEVFGWPISNLTRKVAKAAIARANKQAELECY